MGLWKLELDRRLKTDKSITPMVLGDVKNELLRCLNKRKDLAKIAEILARPILHTTQA